MERKNIIAQWAFDTRPILGRFHLWLEDVEVSGETEYKKISQSISFVDERMERRRAVLDLNDFSKKQIQKQFEWFNYNVYKGYKSIFLLLARIFVSKFNSIPLFNRFYRLITSISIFNRIEIYFDASRKLT